jgi:hypothetical protein
MNPTSKAAAVVAAAGAAALAYLAVTGTVPDAPANGTCHLARVLGPCEIAQQAALRDGEEIPCAPGSEVDVIAELVVGEGETVAAQLPEGVIPYDGSDVEVPCASLKRPGKAVTVRPGTARGPVCIAGLVSKDVSEHADGSAWWTPGKLDICEGPRCRCDDPEGCVRVPCGEMAGRSTWPQRLREQRPELMP